MQRKGSAVGLAVRPHRGGVAADGQAEDLDGAGGAAVGAPVDVAEGSGGDLLGVLQLRRVELPA